MQTRRSAFRRLLTALLGAWFAVLATGVPLSLPAVEAKPSATGRFPCEDCLCGCPDAEYCWRKCCCHTPAQRLAWARREGVVPPRFALDAAESAGLDVTAWRPGATRRIAESLPRIEPLPKKRSCCCCRRPSATGSEAPTPTPPERRRRPPVAVWKAMACQGIQVAWLSVVAFPPPPRCSAEFSLLVAPAPPLAAPGYQSILLTPSPPPPERAACVLVV